MCIEIRLLYDLSGAFRMLSIVYPAARRRKYARLASTWPVRATKRFVPKRDAKFRAWPLGPFHQANPATLRRFELAIAPRRTYHGTMRILLSLIASAAVAATAPTFHRDIEPILQRKCQGCHRAG